MSPQHVPLFLCIHIPEFPAQARLRYQPEQRQQAVVILDGVPPLQQVCSATRKALRDGIAHGMTRTELDSFADVILLPRSLPEERTARNALVELACNFTPRAQVLTQEPTVCVLVLDVSGTEALFGAPQDLALKVKQATATLGLHARIAMSHNFHTAVCAAPYAAANNMLIARGSEQQALSMLPLAALKLTEEQAKTFELWGLCTCGELSALPEVDLIARMGQRGKRLRLLARGELPHLMVPEEETFLLEEYVTFESSVEILDSLLFVMGPMLDQLISRAAARSLALASVTIKLQSDGAAAQESANAATRPEEHIRTIKPALPLMNRDLLLKLIHLDLQAHAPSAAVTAIHLSAEPGDRSKMQLGLFSPQLPEPTRLDITLARIAALIGEERVVRARLLDTHRPDSFVMERFTSPSNLVPLDTSIAESVIALRRLRPPILLRLCMHGNKPASFPLDSRNYYVQEAYGPWRRSGEWWSADVWSREEWDVHATTQSGDTLLCVLVHDLLRKRWQLEALYD